MTVIQCFFLVINTRNRDKEFYSKNWKIVSKRNIKIIQIIYSIIWIIRFVRNFANFYIKWIRV